MPVPRSNSLSGPVACIAVERSVVLDNQAGDRLSGIAIEFNPSRFDYYASRTEPFDCTHVVTHEQHGAPQPSNVFHLSQDTYSETGHLRQPKPHPPEEYPARDVRPQRKRAVQPSRWSSASPECREIARPRRS